MTLFGSKYYVLVNREPSLLNITYNPQKAILQIFLEEMADCIDDIIHCKSRIVLMGDFNINYLEEKENNHLKRFFLPYDLAPANKTTPTHIQHNSGTLIDYIFTDRSLECLKTVIFETPIKSKHLATVLICNKNI